MNKRLARGAFTLIEVMVTVAIVGVLSAIAIPSFTAAIARSKTAETSSNLSALFKGTASYYAAERSGQGQLSGTSGYCTVDDGGPSPVVPNVYKQRFSADATLSALGFNVGDEVYYSYGLVSAGAVGSCGHGPNELGIYTYYANGDLDGDGVLSTFELTAGSNDSNVLYHSIGIYIANETE